MKRKRIKIPSLPAQIVRQWPSSLYKDIRTNRVYTLKALQRLYGDNNESISTQQKEELISPEMKPNWMSNY